MASTIATTPAPEEGLRAQIDAPSSIDRRYHAGKIVCRIKRDLRGVKPAADHLEKLRAAFAHVSHLSPMFDVMERRLSVAKDGEVDSALDALEWAFALQNACVAIADLEVAR